MNNIIKYDILPYINIKYRGLLNQLNYDLYKMIKLDDTEINIKRKKRLAKLKIFNPAELIKRFPKKNWDWTEISRNHNITWDIIKNNPDKNWDWNTISCNPNITWVSL